jgi:hypothetical protein
MLGGWAGLKNGPLVPEAITKVTSFGAGNGHLHCRAWESGPGLKEHEPRRKPILSWIFFVEFRVLRGSCLC